MIEMLQATEPGELRRAAELFREYAASLPFSLCFQGFEEELATLPGKYAPPGGRIVLAYDSATMDSPVGCIALRPIIDARTCEMKRMYVKPSHRGLGIGRRLAEVVISEAQRIGYARMLLDSEPDFTAAMTLYDSLGFKPTHRYNNDPHPQTVFMELTL